MQDDTPLLNEHPDPERWWKNRRRQGWYGLVGAALHAPAFLFGLAWLGPETMEAAQPMFQTSFWGHIALVVVYNGGATLVDAFAKYRSGI